MIKLITFFFSCLSILLFTACPDTDNNQEECLDPICVVKYEGSTPLTESDAIIYDWNDIARHWNGEVNQDTVTIGILRGWDFNQFDYFNLKLKNTSTSMPEYIDFYYYWFSIDVYMDSHLESGTIAIQDWGEDNIYSGKIEGVLANSDSVNLVFWWDQYNDGQ